MTRVLRLRTDLPPTVSASHFYASVAASTPSATMVAFGPGVFRELRRELQSVTSVVTWVADLAMRLDRPVLLNVPTGNGSSQTVVVAPGWSEERLAGYIAGRHQEIEDAFGTISGIRG